MAGSFHYVFDAEAAPSAQWLQDDERSFGPWHGRAIFTHHRLACEIADRETKARRLGAQTLTILSERLTDASTFV